MWAGPGSRFKIGETDHASGVYMSSLFSEGGMHRGSSHVAGRSTFEGEPSARALSQMSQTVPTSRTSPLTPGQAPPASRHSSLGSPSPSRGGIWQGEPVLDRCGYRGKSTVFHQFNVSPTPYSSTCRHGHSYKPLSRQAQLLDADARRRWGLQHEHPGKLD